MLRPRSSTGPHLSMCGVNRPVETPAYKEHDNFQVFLMFLKTCLFALLYSDCSGESNSVGRGEGPVGL